MKTRLIIAFVALACFAGTHLPAQEGGIKSTTTLHPDGTRTDMIKDLSTATAQSKTYDAAGKVLQSMTFKLDEQGEPLEGTAFNTKGVAIFKYSYKRDASGRLEEELNMDARGNLLRRLVYRYTTSGAIAGIDAFDAQGNPIKAATGSARKDKKRK